MVELLSILLHYQTTIRIAPERAQVFTILFASHTVPREDVMITNIHQP